MAVAFGRAGAPVIGFDINAGRVRELKAGNDTTREIDPGDLNHKTLAFTSNSSQLKTADFFIVTVPTPIDDARRPDLTALLNASATVGRALKSGDIVVLNQRFTPVPQKKIAFLFWNGSQALRPASILPLVIRPNVSIQATAIIVSKRSRR